MVQWHHFFLGEDMPKTLSEKIDLSQTSIKSDEIDYEKLSQLIDSQTVGYTKFYKSMDAYGREETFKVEEMEKFDLKRDDEIWGEITKKPAKRRINLLHDDDVLSGSSFYSHANNPEQYMQAYEYEQRNSRGKKLSKSEEKLEIDAFIQDEMNKMDAKYPNHLFW